MSLFGFKEKKEIERLRSMLTPEQVELADLRGAIESAQNQLNQLTDQEQAKKKCSRRIKKTNNRS